MRSYALLVLVAWQLALAEPMREIQPFDVDSDALSNIELLIPMLVSKSNLRSKGKQDSSEEDEQFSSIPAYAFTLDSKTPTESPALRERDLSREGYYSAQLARSLYLEDIPERSDVWRIWSSVARPRSGVTRELLLYLCDELLGAPCAREDAGREGGGREGAGREGGGREGAGREGGGREGAGREGGGREDAGREGGREGAGWEDAVLPWLISAGARRDFMSLGQNPEMVKRYMHMPHKKRPAPWLMD